MIEIALIALALSLLASLWVIRDIQDKAQTERVQLLDRLSVALEKPRPIFHEPMVDTHDEERDPWITHAGSVMETVPEAMKRAS